MMKVSVEIQSSTARFRVAISARSARRALRIVGGRDPCRAVRVRSAAGHEYFLPAKSGDQVVRIEGLETAA